MFSHLVLEVLFADWTVLVNTSSHDRFDAFSIYSTCLCPAFVLLAARHV